MASLAVQVDFMLAGVKDTDGTILAAGKVYTYLPGTTTNKAMYTDAAATTPAANPIVLNNGGIAAVYADGAYKLVIKDSADNTIYTWDNLQWGTPEVRLPELAGNPTLEVDAGYVFTKDDGGVTKPYFMDESGNVSEIALGTGGGDVTGPAGATDTAFARFDLATGKILQNSTSLLSDSGDAYLAGSVRVTAGSAPSNAANKVWVYGKDVSGKPELFAMDEDGNEIQITSGGVLDTSSALASFVVVKLSGDQTIVSGAEDIIEFDTEVDDVGNEWDTGTYTFTAAADGKFFVTLNITANYPVLAIWHPRIYKNAAVYHAAENQEWAVGSAENGARALPIGIDLSAGETISFKLYSEVGQVILKSGVYCMATIIKLGT